MFSGLALKGLLGVGGMLLLALAVWGLISHFEGQGYAKAEAKYKPQLQQANFDRDAAIAANKSLMGTLGGLQSAIRDLTNREATAQKAAREARDRIAAATRESQSEIDRLTAIATGPVKVENTCEEADRLLRDLLAGRLRHN